MKVWVTGSAGMLGKEIALQLSSKEIDFIGTDRTVDITQRKSVELFAATNNITHIINCAAYTKVDLAEGESKKAFQVNATGPGELKRLEFANGPLLHRLCL